MLFQKKLVIFDLDGTLLNTIADLAKAVNIALTKYGFPIHNQDTIRSYVGNGISKLLERSLPKDKQTEDNVALLRLEFLRYYNKHNADLSTPYPGVISMLEYLQQKGIMLAVASNKYQEATEKLVNHFFPTIKFFKVCGQKDSRPIKPHPAVVLGIIKAAGVEHDKVLYIGDSGVDMQTAKNANVDVIAVTWGFRTREQLEEFKPLAFANKAEDIKGYVL